jgi:hypothetical protein
MRTYHRSYRAKRKRIQDRCPGQQRNGPDCRSLEVEPGTSLQKCATAAFLRDRPLVRYQYGAEKPDPFCLCSRGLRESTDGDRDGREDLHGE